MKVYVCSSTRYENPFDQFLGKDAWVACSVKGRTYWHYLRFFSKDPDGTYHIEFADPEFIEDDGKYHCDSKSFNRMMSNKGYWKATSDILELVQPLEVLTTDELFEIDDDDGIAVSEFLPRFRT